uniref:Tripartite motif-containing protein 3 n=1 Tax=Magallana gigas TaxID=29159 RepID=K1QDA4_MAGGI
MPLCVHWSSSTGDLLVAMFSIHIKTGKVVRYNHSRQLTQTIQNDNTGLKLYVQPHYITENNNGDVVVSDWKKPNMDHMKEYIQRIDFTCFPIPGSVVVTERGGRHRFSYTGHPSRSRLLPCGICTDALSHILVCDELTKTVQILDRDGQFLERLLTKSQEMGGPQSLSYDVNTHRLWLGSLDNNKIFVFEHTIRHDPLTVPCSNTDCHHINKIATGKKHGRVWDANTKLATAAINIPPVSEKVITNRMKEAELSVEEIAKESMQEAISEEMLKHLD